MKERTTGARKVNYWRSSWFSVESCGKVWRKYWSPEIF
jgi:hypothetical protein